MSPLYLGIDTATRFLSLALWTPDRGRIAEAREDVGRDHAARIVHALRQLFDRARAEPTTIAGIGVGIGPGSYTGVRVGVATAKGLARAWNVPLSGASTLAAMALTGLEPGESGAAVLDARRGNVYVALYRRSADPTDLHLDVLRSPEKLPRADLAALGAERIVEDTVPDAALMASEATSRAPAEAVYL